MLLPVLTYGLYGMNVRDLWETGFGAIDGRFLIRGFPSHSGLLITAVTSNLPQILVSTMYIAYNNLFTRMLFVKEWSSYAHERKFLRVTSPVGNQRSTHYLQLPYRYGIPLLLVSGLLHWLASQSFFLARIEAINHEGTEDKVQSFSTCGWSPKAMIGVVFVGILYVFATILISCQRYKPGMTLPGNGSVAIGAACHPPNEDRGASTKAIMWGRVKNISGDSMLPQIQEYSFTSFEVEPPDDEQERAVSLGFQSRESSSDQLYDTLIRNGILPEHHRAITHGQASTEKLKSQRRIPAHDYDNSR